jgi:hypothetical protein
MTEKAQPRHRLGRSAAAILIAILLNVVLALAIDELLHLTNVYPPWNQPMPDTGDNLLALSYRLVITVFAGVVALRFADYALGRHAIALGLVGTALGLLGVVIATRPGMNLGPLWYPWSLASSAIPCTWLAWAIARRG